MPSRRLLLSLLLLPLPSPVVHADPLSTSRVFQVEAVVANGCVFGTATSDNVYDLGILSLDTLGNLTSPVNAASSSGAGSIVLTCILEMTVSAVLDYGVDDDSNSQRYLERVSGNETLAYQFYQDAAYSQVWGNGAFVRTIANFPANTQTYTVYVRLFAVDGLPFAGNYRNTVTVTLSF